MRARRRSVWQAAAWLLETPHRTVSGMAVGGWIASSDGENLHRTAVQSVVCSWLRGATGARFAAILLQALREISAWYDRSEENIVAVEIVSKVVASVHA